MPRLALLVLTALAALLGAASAAPAASVEAPPMTQPAGLAACLSSAPAARGLCGEAPALRGVGAPVAAPGGRDVYVPAARTGRIVRLRADRPDAGLRPGGHVAVPAVAALALSADGRWLAAVAPRRAALTLLRRAPRSGRLRVVSCLAARPSAERGTAGCERAPVLRGARDVAISDDARSVYVTLGARGAIVGFARRGTRLTRIAGAGGCLVEAGRAGGRGLGGCDATTALAGAAAVDVAPDGRTVYVVAADDDALLIAHRSPADGTLRVRGCVSDDGAGFCERAPALDGPTTVVVSPDGANVYVGSAEERSVTAFARDRRGELTQIGCYGSGPYLIRDEICVLVPQLVAPSGIAVTPGRWLVVADPAGSAVSSFAREFSGDLVPIVPPNGCMSPFGGGCLVGQGLAGAAGVAAVDARTVVATSRRGAAIVRLPR